MPVDKIVVLIKFKDISQYYVTEKEAWILNEEILRKAFEKKGYETVEYKEDIRYGFTILSEKNITEFLERVVEFRVEKNELQEFYNIYNELYDDVGYVALPIFYIDFDNRIFYSFFTELGSYEVYMPYGWKGYLHMGQADEYIPLDEKYWTS